jgi:hypothetical protein
MKKYILSLALVLALPMVVRAETWSAVPIVDHNCYDKVKADPDTHTTECALSCAKSGYGIIASDGTFLKFDDAGNKKALSLLKATSKKDHLRVTVSGKRVEDSIQVQTIKLD